MAPLRVVGGQLRNNGLMGLGITVPLLEVESKAGGR